MCVKRHAGLAGMQCWGYTSSMDSAAQKLPDEAESNTHELALEQAYSGRLPLTEDGFVRVPTALFIPKVDLKMPTLPDAAFYIRDTEGEIQTLKQEGGKFSVLALSNYDEILMKQEDGRYAQGIC